MSKSKALHSPEEIIAKGEEIERIQGPGVEPWTIYRELGGRGNFRRLEEIWKGHVASRAGLPTRADPEGPAVDELPEAIAAGLDMALEGARTAVRALFVGEDQRRTAASVRQAQATECRHADELADRDRQVAYWRAQAIEASDLLDDLHEELDAAKAWAEHLEEELDDTAAEREEARREVASLKLVLNARRLDLPVRGATEPLVSSVRVPVAPEGLRPEPLSEASRRALGRTKTAKAVGEAATPDPAALPPAGSDVLPGQLAMPL